MAGGTACPTTAKQAVIERWDRRFRLSNYFSHTLVSGATAEDRRSPKLTHGAGGQSAIYRAGAAVYLPGPKYASFKTAGRFAFSSISDFFAISSGIFLMIIDFTSSNGFSECDSTLIR